jgi:hypothetical protein
MRVVLGLSIVYARLFVPATQPSVKPALRPALPLPQAEPRYAPAVLMSSEGKSEARSPSWAIPLFALLTAGFISAATPVMSHASVTPVSVAQQYGSSMIAATGDDDLSERQKEFLAQREQLRQKYDADTDSTYKPVGEVRDKKNIYTTIVGGLVAIAFIAPMIQFFYYTGGD